MADPFNPLAQITTDALGPDIAANLVKAHGPDAAADAMAWTYYTDQLLKVTGAKDFAALEAYPWRDVKGRPESLDAALDFVRNDSIALHGPYMPIGLNGPVMRALRSYTNARDDFFNHSLDYYESLPASERPATLAAIAKADGVPAADTMAKIFPLIDATKETRAKIAALDAQRIALLREEQRLQFEHATSETLRAHEDKIGVVDKSISDLRGTGNYNEKDALLKAYYAQIRGGGDGKVPPQDPIIGLVKRLEATIASKSIPEEKAAATENLKALRDAIPFIDQPPPAMVPKVGLTEQNFRTAYLAHMTGRTPGVPKADGVVPDPSLNLLSHLAVRALGKDAVCSANIGGAEGEIQTQLNTLYLDRLLQPYTRTSDTVQQALQTEQSEQNKLAAGAYGDQEYNLRMRQFRAENLTRVTASAFNAIAGNAPKVDQLTEIGYTARFQGRPLGITPDLIRDNGPIACPPGAPGAVPGVPGAAPQNGK